MIRFVAQYKNDNIDLNRRAAVAGALALVRAICKWKIVSCESLDAKKHSCEREGSRMFV